MKNLNYRRVLLLLSAVAVMNLSARATEDADRSGQIRKDREMDLKRDYSGKMEGKHGQHIQASKIIGKKVSNYQDERLGKVDDLILGDNFAVKYAVISVGGALGVGDDKIAVPISDLNCSGDSVRISASKEDLQAAAKNPTGEWMAVSGQEWTKDITSYYGHPSTGNRDRSNMDSRFEREPVLNTPTDNEAVRTTTQGAGAQNLRELTEGANPQIRDNANPNDATLRQSVNSTLRQNYDNTTSPAVTVSVENGEVTLRGTVANRTEKQNIESRVKAINGVKRVNNQLTIRE